MGGLIPFRLQHSTDPSSSNPVPSPTSVLPDIPRSMGRQRPGPVTALTIFPYTEVEWRAVMEETKTLYVSRQYKQCSARCIQILENIKDPYRVHPLYQIYLSFFAASSLELTSRPLHLNSSAKLPLLQQALEYYQNAESNMEYASCSADPKISKAVRQTRNKSISSISSSIRSSVDSVFSQPPSSRSSTTSSITSSPTSSCYSSSDEAIANHRLALSTPAGNSDECLSPAPLRIKKKVAFSIQLPHLLSKTELELAEDSTIINAFPSPPSSISGPPSPSSESSVSNFLLARALIRYRGQLADLRDQVNYHIGSVKSQITAIQNSRKSWRSNLPSLFTSLEQERDGTDGDDKEKVELKARIARLKDRGWKRERFDGSRYQILCEKALGELD